MSSLRIAVAQPTTLLGNVPGNVAAHAAAVRRAATDLVVFPEMSLTGYAIDAPVITVDDPVLEPLIEACRLADSIALVGSAVPTPTGGRGIGVLAVSGYGARLAYVKMSLGEQEAVHFEPGDSPASVVVKSWRIGIGVCKDTRITEHLDRTADLGIDVYVAGLVHARSEFAELGERARSIATTYRVPVAFAGFAGPTGGGYPQTCGGSGIWNTAGETVQQLGPEPDGIACEELHR